MPRRHDQLRYGMCGFMSNIKDKSKPTRDENTMVTWNLMFKESVKLGFLFRILMTKYLKNEVGFWRASFSHGVHR